jgi:hypothetical protein
MRSLAIISLLACNVSSARIQLSQLDIDNRQAGGNVKGHQYTPSIPTMTQFVKLSTAAPLSSQTTVGPLVDSLPSTTRILGRAPQIALQDPVAMLQSSFRELQSRTDSLRSAYNSRISSVFSWNEAGPQSTGFPNGPGIFPPWNSSPSSPSTIAEPQRSGTAAPGDSQTDQSQIVPIPSGYFMPPKYTNCAGNAWNGTCPTDLACVGDPRPRGITMDAICVPTSNSCGGHRNALCSEGLICVSDPKSEWYGFIAQV